jgi:hypothetical protein
MNAMTVAGYLATLPPDRRAEVARVRRVIRKHLPKGYKEGVEWGMISYGVPLRVYPDTYNGKPLCYAAIAAQKGYSSLYLMSVYGSPALTAELKAGFRKAGKKLNMGKSCIRFRRAEELDLDTIGRIVGKVPPAKYVALAEAARRR